jgi:hypothetical protein
LFRNRKIESTEAVFREGDEETEVVGDEVIPKITVWKGRPPDPRLPLKSTGKESHGPIDEGTSRFTTGTEGCEGPNKVTLCGELNCQLLQGLAFDRSVHFALTRDPLNMNESPIFNKGAVGEVDIMTKLLSSCHTQRLDDVIARDRMISSHRNTFQDPALFVGVSNSTNTLEPSLENTAELITGGEGC